MVQYLILVGYSGAALSIFEVRIRLFEIHLFFNILNIWLSIHFTIAHEETPV